MQMSNSVIQRKGFSPWLNLQLISSTFGPLPRILHLHIPILFTSLSTSSSSSSFACNDRQHPLVFRIWHVLSKHTPPPPPLPWTQSLHPPACTCTWLVARQQIFCGSVRLAKALDFYGENIGNRIQLSKTHSMAWWGAMDQCASTCMSPKSHVIVTIQPSVHKNSERILIRWFYIIAAV